MREHWRFGEPIRALTVGVTKLLPADQVSEQLSMFDPDDGDRARRERRERLEAAVDALRRKHGDGSIHLGPGEEEIGSTPK